MITIIFYGLNLFLIIYALMKRKIDMAILISMILPFFGLIELIITLILNNNPLQFDVLYLFGHIVRPFVGDHAWTIILFADKAEQLMNLLYIQICFFIFYKIYQIKSLHSD